jgi:hypothetical protein
VVFVHHLPYSVLLCVWNRLCVLVQVKEAQYCAKIKTTDEMQRKKITSLINCHFHNVPPPFPILSYINPIHCLLILFLEELFQCYPICGLVFKITSFLHVFPPNSYIHVCIPHVVHTPPIAVFGEKYSSGYLRVSLSLTPKLYSNVNSFSALIRDSVYNVEIQRVLR